MTDDTQALFQFLRRARAWFERLISPGLSTCFRCNRPWRHPAHRTRWGYPNKWDTHFFPRRDMRRITIQKNRNRFFGLVGVESHSTPYKTDDGAQHGCFPLCESCWQALAPEQRWPYYELLVHVWISQTPSSLGKYMEDAEQIKEAVLDGR